MWLLGFIVAVFLNTGVHATLLGRSNFNVIKALYTFSTLTVLVKRFWDNLSFIHENCHRQEPVGHGLPQYAISEPFPSCSKPLFQSEAEREAIDMKIISCK